MKAHIVGLTLLVVALPNEGRAASSFDGSWTVSQSCGSTADDVHGYAWTYPAAVKNGMLSGQHSPSSPQDGSIRLQGKITVAGEAMLTANGVTGRSEYSVGHVAPGQPVHFHVQAHFDQSSGTGRRVELRPCDFSFTRN